MRITIDVTADDIANGVRGRCSTCPVALAVRRVPGLEKWEVGGMSAFYGASSFPLPCAASRFIMDFDGGRPVEPFSFEVDVPDEYLTATG
jgi:hypothetical protein